MCTLRGAGLWLRLSRQRGVVHLAALGLEDADIGGHSVPAFHLHQITHHKLVGIDLELVPVSDYSCLLWGRGTRVVDKGWGWKLLSSVGLWGDEQGGELRTYRDRGRPSAKGRPGLMGGATPDARSLPAPVWSLWILKW